MIPTKQLKLDRLGQTKEEDASRVELVRADWNGTGYDVSACHSGAAEQEHKDTSPDTLWSVVRNQPHRTAAIQEGDCLRLGRFKLQIRQVVWNDGDQLNAQLPAVEKAQGAKPSVTTPPPPPAVAPPAPTALPVAAVGGGREEAQPVEGDGQPVQTPFGLGATSAYTPAWLRARDELARAAEEGEAGAGAEENAAADGEREGEEEEGAPAVLRSASSATAGRLGVPAAAAADRADAITNVNTPRFEPDSGGDVPSPAVAALPEGEENCEFVCRICLSEEEDEDTGPLVSPCVCKGSMSLVHLHCLRTWMEGRLKIERNPNGHAQSFFWRSLDCELCKAPYPTFVDAKGERLKLFEVPEPEAPYVCLSVTIKQRGQMVHGFHLVSLAHGRIVKLGRGHSAEVRISDISVSRTHATLRVVGGRVLIEDMRSKFGTLLAVKGPLQLAPSQGVSVQVGRSCLVLDMKSQWRGLGGGFRCLCAAGADESDVRLIERESRDPPEGESPTRASRGRSPNGGRGAAASPANRSPSSPPVQPPPPPPPPGAPAAAAAASAGSPAQPAVVPPGDDSPVGGDALGGDPFPSSEDSILGGAERGGQQVDSGVVDQVAEFAEGSAGRAAMGGGESVPEEERVAVEV
uniref:FHA domain-containing protein n=1 Tax=Chromera velia CCMP2878 TaxID=1169474 RepID=A0A0G4H284_9ALVE|eukprot:Cvel_24401.t1-p1 / transcript=Cvel_24401.t1 / gene=Cvel_24401 / organism=Chromera_velia_CCMP2878 / gene_product=hypothetical protein / transcript_product=hypothetical protein / location=Cvel_scaffold2632:22885-25905(+) / protein_length=632 / sequence_SO=supercontig / SO=protein_coding / is_pseudo=false